MAKIDNTVPVAGLIAPLDSADKYPVFDPQFGLGGLRTVATTTDRNNITDLRREVGMFVHVSADSKYYTLSGGVTNNDWVEVTGLFGSTTTSTVTANLAVGALAIGDTIPAGSTLQSIIEKIVLTTYNPTLVAPSVSFTSSIGTTVESGTTGLTLTASFSKGAINGTLVNGLWSSGTKQNDRSGAATKYTINGTDNNTTNNLSLPSTVIADGANTFTSTVSYAAGPQPTDSKGANYSTALAAGSISTSVTVTGKRKTFYGVNSSPTTSAQVRALSNSVLGHSNGSTFTINVSAGTTQVVFAYPATLQAVTSVINSGTGYNDKSSFEPSTVSVEGVNSYTATNYRVYVLTPANPYTTSFNYTVTI